MPIYDYRCNSCKKRASLFFRSFAAAANVVCPSCGSTDLKRIITAPTVLKSAESRAGRTDAILRSGENDMLDKRRIAEWSRRVGEDLGGEAGALIREKVERMESGEFVPEMTDARFFAEYAAGEQKKEIMGQPSDLSGGSGSSDSSSE